MYERLTKRVKPDCLKPNLEIYKEYAVTIKNEMIAFEGCFDNKDVYEDYRMALDRLCDLEDKIEQGKIVELPCAVGQTIYVITTDSPTRIEETKISQVVVRLKDNGKPQYSILAPCVYDDWGKAKWSFCDNNFGTDFFLDRAAAKAKLREIEGDNNE